jgi:hypothetical protein
MADETSAGIRNELGDTASIGDLAREIANIKQALGLLGVKLCSACGHFFLGSDPASFFSACGESVC